MHPKGAVVVSAVAVAASLVVGPANAGSVAAACRTGPGDGASRSPVPVGAAVAEATPGVEETRIHWTRWHRRVVYGDTAVLAGQVVAEDGAVTDASVDLFAREAGRRNWAFVGSVRSDADTGVFELRCLRPDPTTDYRAVYQGTAYYAGTEGRRRTRVARAAPDRMRQVAPDRFRYAGAVRPRYVQDSVRLQTRQCRRCRWRTTARDTTNRRSRWAFRISTHTFSGRRWFRAVVPAGDGYVRGRSAHVWRITAR